MLACVLQGSFSVFLLAQKDPQFPLSLQPSFRPLFALLLLLACGSKKEAPTPAATQQDGASKGAVVDSGAGETGTDSVSVDDGKNKDGGPAGVTHQDVAHAAVDVLGVTSLILAAARHEALG